MVVTPKILLPIALRLMCQPLSLLTTFCIIVPRSPKAEFDTILWNLDICLCTPPLEERIHVQPASDICISVRLFSVSIRIQASCSQIYLGSRPVQSVSHILQFVTTSVILQFVTTSVILLL